jgi:hypothetical protein
MKTESSGATLAGELLHIGKNTSFGFGKYTLINSYEQRQ